MKQEERKETMEKLLKRLPEFKKTRKEGRMFAYPNKVIVIFEPTEENGTLVEIYDWDGNYIRTDGLDGYSWTDKVREVAKEF
jgi:hypothetical protein